MEVAAYFATTTKSSSRIGAIFAYPIEEYNQLMNPFAGYGISKEQNEKLLGERALPPLVNEDFEDVPRIFSQEGLFVKCPQNRVQSLQENCIDRYYFYQSAEQTYRGNLAFATGSMKENQFATKEAYSTYVELVRKQFPKSFIQTQSLNEYDLFPPIDNISHFAVEWKRTHPDPTTRIGKEDKILVPIESAIGAPTQGQCMLSLFSKLTKKYYFSDINHSPYESRYTSFGRKFIESLCQYKEMSDINNLKWLLWQLLMTITNRNYRCTLKVELNENNEVFLIVYDRWLTGTYKLTLPIEKAEKSLWHFCFENPFYRCFDEEIQPQSTCDLFSNQHNFNGSFHNPYGGNSGTEKIFKLITKEMENRDEGEYGSFVFDFQNVVMQEIGRDFHIILGFRKINSCLFSSQMVLSDCDELHSELFVEIFDGFFKNVKQTSICREHLKNYCEGDFNLLSPSIDFPLGLA